ncbi:MAG: TIGR03936 family radical SAM-associated protein [Lachnospiraceae bacterium]|nr:TIGR03936 family radical SAM-associated protein [Lachnospiraceae bacterium]
MRVRIRFSKTGPIRYVGHLDFMRTFQKAVKKSGLAAVYSAGFNPHMLISFAAPLGVGEETTGDYADVDFAYRDPAELTEHEAYRLTHMELDQDTLPNPPYSEEMTAILSAAMPPGVTVNDTVRVGLTKDSKAMALVRNASWELILSDEAAAQLPAEELQNGLEAFMARESIIVRKKTKKSEKDVDIRPLIGKLALKEAEEDGSRKLVVCITCATGSMENLKPVVILQAVSEQLELAHSLAEGVLIRRTEIYDEEMRPLSALGTRI